MWQLNSLSDPDAPKVCINGKWVPARPLNFQKEHTSLVNRIKDAWEVFIRSCRKTPSF